MPLFNGGIFNRERFWFWFFYSAFLKWCFIVFSFAYILISMTPMLFILSVFLFFFLFMAKLKICFMDFSNLIKLWFNVLIFMIILLGFNLACCICGFRVFIKFGEKITHYVIIYPPSLFLDSNYLNVNLLDIPQLTEGLYYFFKFVPSIFLHSVL